ncbi:hypothetical protein NP493_464g00009 [Ridgeia piscesae]|uniref:Smr domain-containing protein n=1 Tax=Ridgeia piscesae TaxID=27915 RepID=A0AAD9KZ35_RIDPI|nr:hypothetical protein NP493_464g00009 [Ridgeia piscesae]
MHYRLRLECFEKARDAYRQHMMGVAAFYSQQGHVHTQKMKAANEAAGQKILQHRNPHLSQARCVDLHGLHVAEAVHTLEQLLTDRERALRYQPDKRRRHLLVMTGKGNHSHGGVARIRLAVFDYLKKNNYR